MRGVQRLGRGWVLSHLLSANFPAASVEVVPLCLASAVSSPVPFLELQRHPPYNTVDESENSLQSQLSSSSLHLTALPRDLWMDDLGIVVLQDADPGTTPRIS